MQGENSYKSGNFTTLLEFFVTITAQNPATFAAVNYEFQITDYEKHKKTLRLGLDIKIIDFSTEIIVTNLWKVPPFCGGFFCFFEIWE